MKMSITVSFFSLQPFHSYANVLSQRYLALEARGCARRRSSLALSSVNSSKSFSWSVVGRRFVPWQVQRQVCFLGGIGRGRRCWRALELVPPVVAAKIQALDKPPCGQLWVMARGPMLLHIGGSCCLGCLFQPCSLL